MATPKQIKDAFMVAASLPASERMVFAAKLLGGTCQMSATEIVSFSIRLKDYGRVAVVVGIDHLAKLVSSVGDRLVIETRPDDAEISSVDGDGGASTHAAINESLK